MPQPIPITYTGKDAAVPDWKSFFQDRNQRLERIHQRKQQQQQFEALQKERRRKEFIESIDVDTINTTHDTLKAMEYEMVDGFHDWATEITKKRGEDYTDEDLFKASLLQSRISQDLQKMEGWSKNYAIDMKTAEKNMHLYDKEKVKEKIVNWNPRTDGAYNKSKLDECYRDVPLNEVRYKLKNTEFKDPNIISNTAEKAGLKIANKETFQGTFWDIDTDDNGNIIRQEPKYDNQVGYLKAAIIDSGEEGLLYELAYDKQFNALDDKVKQNYQQAALQATGSKEDAKYLYELNENGETYFPSKSSIRTTPTSKKSTSETKDDRIVINPDQATTTEYNTGKTSNKYIGLGENIQKNEQGNINKPENVSSDEKLGNTIPASKMKNYDIVGLDLDDTKNPKAHLKVEIAERQKTKDGKPVYNWFGYKGTEEEIRKQIYDEETEQKSFLGVKYGDKDTSDAAKTYQEFQQDKNKAEFKVFESKGTLDVLAPIKDNPQIAKQFRGIESVSKTNDDDGNIKVLSGQIDTTQLEKGNKYKVNDQVYVWNGQKLVKE